MKILLLFNLLCVPLFLTAGEKLPEDLSAVVDSLIRETRNSSATFIRNSKVHTAEEAAEHLRKKYEHFLKKGKIKTPEDFIKYAGTKSLISGKPYMLMLKDGTEIENAKWLTARLSEIRKTSEQDQGN